MLYHIKNMPSCAILDKETCKGNNKIGQQALNTGKKQHILLLENVNVFPSVSSYLKSNWWASLKTYCKQNLIIYKALLVFCWRIVLTTITNVQLNFPFLSWSHPQCLIAPIRVIVIVFVFRGWFCFWDVKNALWKRPALLIPPAADVASNPP